MDRIIYELGAKELGYVWSGRGRVPGWVAVDLGEVDEIPITLRIVDMLSEKDKICGQKGGIGNKKSIEDRNQQLWDNPTTEMVEIVLNDVIRLVGMKKERIHTLYLIDGMDWWQSEVDFVGILRLLLRDLNQLVIVTAVPEKYEKLLEEVFEETGLIGNCIENLKQVIDRKQVRETLILDFTKKESIFVHAFPKNSIYLDLYSKKAMAYFLQVKRADICYTSFAKFLDSRAKNRYNTLVNEGIVNYMFDEGNSSMNMVQKLLNKYRIRCKMKGRK